MSQNVVIRENIDEHMLWVKKYLDEQRDTRLEGMSDFFAARLDSYETVMSDKREAYTYLAEIIPEITERLLDLGCGTGLEIDEIRAAWPDIEITGVDLTEEMLARLRVKHPTVRTICADYFEYDCGKTTYDLVISVESLHHFKPEKKLALFEKIYAALKPGGSYIEADYLACCQAEETLMADAARNKRTAENIPDDVFIHFDTPLTVAHETALMRDAGFESVELAHCIKAVCFIVAKKRADF